MLVLLSVSIALQLLVGLALLMVGRKRISGLSSFLPSSPPTTQ